MKHLLRMLAILVVAVTATPSFALDETVARAIMKRAVDDYIRPAYRDFQTSASALTSETRSFCANPTAAGLRSVQDRFGELAVSWGHIEFLRDGPVMRENRFERVLFYPDRKSTGLKQVQALLAEPDEAYTDAAGLKNRSVALQGLGAFEFVFSGKRSRALLAEKNGFACRYGMAIAGNVEAIAAELVSEWDAPDGIQEDWKNPSADNPVFRDGDEAVQSQIGIQVHGIETVRDQRIAAFYTGRDHKMSPKSALFWRSDNTFRVIAANLDGMETLWKVSGMEELLPADARSLSDSVLFDYRTALRTAGAMQQPTDERLGDPRYLAKLDFLELTLKDAITRINDDIGAAIGLGAGFSFSDGD